MLSATQRPASTFLVWQLAFTAALAGLALSALVPLTYDEAWNYINLVSRGPLYVLGDYEYPNNHVLFTLTQTLLPAMAVARNPHTLRLVNVLVAGSLLALLAVVVSRETRSQFTAMWVSLGLALCSPLFTLYLLLARGYLLGTSLLLLAVLCAATARPFSAGVLLGLSTATVPTFAFAGPGVLAGLWSEGSSTMDRVRRAVTFAAPAALLGFMTYGRHLDRINAHRRAAWTANVTITGFCRDTLGWLGNALPSSIAVVALLAISAWASGLLRIQRREAPSTRLVAFLILAVTSFYAVVALCALTHVANLPFARNALFVPLFVWLAAFLVGQRGGLWLRRITFVALVGNGLWGARLFTRSFVFPHETNGAYPHYGNLSATASEHLSGLAQQMDVRGVIAEWAAEPVAALYAARLRVPARRVEGMAEGPCDLGDGSPGEKGTRVWVEVSGRARPLLLCR